MKVKYGKIICDPTSDEAKKLIGKKVVASDSYKVIDECDGAVTEQKVLVGINERSSSPFLLEGNVQWNYTFIREVIEEQPKYRPYENTDEMIEDYKERFKDKIVTSPIEMPTIWLKGKVSGCRLLAKGYSDDMVFLSYDGKFYLSDLFDCYTYLDGSPVGKSE